MFFSVFEVPPCLLLYNGILRIPKKKNSRKTKQTDKKCTGNKQNKTKKFSHLAGLLAKCTIYQYQNKRARVFTWKIWKMKIQNIIDFWSISFFFVLFCFIDKKSKNQKKFFNFIHSSCRWLFVSSCFEISLFSNVVFSSLSIFISFRCTMCVCMNKSRLHNLYEFFFSSLSLLFSSSFLLSFVIFFLLQKKKKKNFPSIFFPPRLNFVQGPS